MAQVTKSLLYLKDQGWNVVIFKTQQLLAAAWRGDDVDLPEESFFPNHCADEWSIPKHIPDDLLWPPLNPESISISRNPCNTEDLVQRN